MLRATDIVISDGTGIAADFLVTGRAVLGLAGGLDEATAAHQRRLFAGRVATDVEVLIRLLDGLDAEPDAAQADAAQADAEAAVRRELFSQADGAAADRLLRAARQRRGGRRG